VSDVAFDSTLGRASYVVTKSGDSSHVRRFSPDTLAEIARRRRAGHERPRVAATATGWRLRPFWHSLAQPRG
jgi:hypothetical protein